MSVYRIYVEKKSGYDVEAQGLTFELKHIYRLTSLTNIRILNRYDVEGLDMQHLETAKNTIFAEPQLDNIYETLPQDYDYILAVEYLPGQFDQRADSCAQCLQMLSGGEKPLVRSARVYLINGELNKEDISIIHRHLINPVESMEATMEIPATLVADYPAPPKVETLDGFISCSVDKLSQYIEKYGLAMDEADLEFCRNYFQKEGRDPTLTELRIIDTYWSDHCRHTTFLTNLENIKIDDENVKSTFEKLIQRKKETGRANKPITLMEIATLGARILEQTNRLNALDKSDEINACSVKIKVDEDGVENDWLLMFKNETHNHPTEIEPFGGAATCIGGAIRDPLSGRSYVYQAMRVTGAGDPTAPVSETLAGKLPQRVITSKAARGYSSYGNQIGLATGLVREIYHPGYIAKRMEVGAVIGAARAKDVVRKKPQAGDFVILLGGRTGRDGCGGATGSSKSHNTDSLSQCGAEVQKGNAPEERKIQRLFRNPEVTHLIKKCNDFGAGGVAVAVGELADGLNINLSAVPKKYNGLDATELAISESQERMAVVVSAEDADKFIRKASEENLEATIIAEVTDSARLVMKYDGETIADISREFLDTNGAEKYAAVEIASLPCGKSDITINAESLKDALTDIITDLNVCSQKGLVEMFDSSIGAATVLMPFSGRHQMTPTQAMVAKLPVEGAQTKTCSIMSYAFYPYVSSKNPYVAAYLAVASSVSKIIAAGGSLNSCWLSFQEYFERLGSDSKRWGKPFAALLGAFKAQIDLSVASIGGKDSMSGSFEDLDVPPTLISFAVSTANADNIISGDFKQQDSTVVLMAPKYQDDGMPEKQSLLDMLTETSKLIHDKKVLSSYVVEAGGVGEAIFKMTLGNNIGFEFDSIDINILSEHNIGSIVLELTHYEECEKYIKLGKTTSRYTITMGDETADCSQLQVLYETRLEAVFPTRSETMDDEISLQISNEGESLQTSKPPTVLESKPRVLIPVFPGTNCEYDMAKVFTKAGADTSIFVIKNLTPSDIKWSVQALSEAIEKSQIIAIPGGFSGGDEPDGSAKFIVSLMKNPRIKDAIHDLLKNRDGLMCGICNGFQALIKLGLAVYGEILEANQNSPTLTFNSIGRHQSMLVRTRISANKSPWLEGTNVGDIHTIPISHGEGRFVAPQTLIDRLAQSGQIVSQYVDMSGEPTMDVRYNPNGSMCAIEGIISPDGRVIGKMGHNERSGKDLFKNVPDSGGLDIFTPAVKYYAI